jgi:hypothetical protein
MAQRGSFRNLPVARKPSTRPAWTAVAAIATAACTAGCAGTRQDVLSAYQAGDGEVRTYNATFEQTWAAAHAALVWNHAAAIEEHRDQGFMLGTAPAQEWSWGASMGIWIDPADARSRRVRAVVSRTLATNVTAQNETTLLDDMGRALVLEKQGAPLPAESPE